MKIGGRGFSFVEIGEGFFLCENRVKRFFLCENRGRDFSSVKMGGGTIPL